MQRILLVLILTLVSGYCEDINPWELPICDECPYKSIIPGIVPRDEYGEHCKCSHPFESCLETANECPIRQICEMRLITNCLFKENGACTIDSAVCVDFKRCPGFYCWMECKESGFIIDRNNCKRCWCNDMCKEIGCSKENCTIRNVPGEHPIVRCEKK